MLGRFSRPATASVIVAVALAFCAGVLVGNRGAGGGGRGGASATARRVPNFGQTMQLITSDAIRSVTIDQRQSTLHVVLASGQRYATGYPSGYVSQVVGDVIRHEGGSALSVVSRS